MTSIGTGREDGGMKMIDSSERNSDSDYLLCKKRDMSTGSLIFSSLSHHVSFRV